MEETILIIITLICLVVGFIGSVLPVLPGTVLSWIGLVTFKFTSYADYSWLVVIIAAVIVILFQFLNYFLPSYGAKKFGGSKYGIWGATIGLLIGVLFSPFGLISIFIMPFIGAFAGEFLIYRNDGKKSLKAAFGVFIGFMISTGIGMLISLLFLVFVMYQLSVNANWNWV